MKNLSEFKVLIVDDTEENIDILIEAIGNEYDIAVAIDGQTALEILEEEIPDIILLDIIMPDMDGYEVCRRIKENNKISKIPIIFLTAITDIDSKVKGFELGANDYITKPFDVFEVKNKVNNHLYLKYKNI